MHPICVAIFVGVFILAYLISKSAKWWSKKAEYDEYGLDEIPLGEVLQGYEIWDFKGYQSSNSSFKFLGRTLIIMLFFVEIRFRSVRLCPGDRQHSI